MKVCIKCEINGIIRHQHDKDEIIYELLIQLSLILLNNLSAMTL